MKDSNITPLCKLAYEYGVDKCRRIAHPYTPFYYELLKDKKGSIKKVLEMGIGYRDVMTHVERIKGFYRNGASLYMWRDFFPNAEIYGADILPELIFEDIRIKTYVCDQTNEEDLARLVRNVGSDVDLFIDDGSHEWQDQAFTCQKLLPLLKKGVIYIIEDVKSPEAIIEALPEYDCLIPHLPKRYPDDCLIVVRNKNQ